MKKNIFGKITPPDNSRMENDGSYTVMVIVDIMLNKGNTFFATFKKRMPVHIDFALQRYVIDAKDLEASILKRFPSLKSKDWGMYF